MRLLSWRPDVLSVVASLIQRSAGRPLDLGLPLFPERINWNALHAIIHSNLHRIRVLGVHQFRPLPLSSKDAPMLEEIEANCDVDFPNAPRLLRARVRGLSFDDEVQPFMHLVRFSGYMNGDFPSDARRLFQLCPNLVSLHLSGIDSDPPRLLPVLPARRSLVDLTLDTYYGLGDYLQLWHGHAFRSLQVPGRQHLVPCLHVFGSVGCAVQHLRWDKGAFHFETADGSRIQVAYYTFGGSEGTLLDDLPHMQAQLGSLTHLELREGALLLALISASISLPALQHISVCNILLPAPGFGTLHAPLLKTFVFQPPGLNASDVRSFPTQMSELWKWHFGPPGSRLERMVLRDVPASFTEGLDFRPLLQCSSAVFLGTELVCNEDTEA